VSLNESDDHYEVVVKHSLRGVLHIGLFETLNQARSYLLYCWAKLPAMAQVDCGAAIYDKRDFRKRVLTLGADYLVKEERNEPLKKRRTGRTAST
jgi:hypothetical protein